MAFTLIGEAVLLIAYVMLAAGEPGGSLDIGAVVAALPASPWRDAALALLIVGFGMKIALVPLNGWMPLAYTAAPIPAAAVLSGAAVKAGVIGLIRFLPSARLAGLGRGARVGRVRLRILRRGDRPDPARSEDDPRLFEHQPDGGDRRGLRDGTRRRRPGRGAGRGLLCREPRSGEGRPVPDSRRRRRARRAAAGRWR